MGPSCQTIRKLLSRSLLTALRLLLLAATCQSFTGCSVIRNGTHVLLTDPVHFPNNLNHVTTRHDNRAYAKQVLKRLTAANPDIPASKEYAAGFVDGFVDHVTYGPRTAPPVLPPSRFWKKKYATPAGHAAAREWHIGFADGSQAAANSGLRQLQLVPSSLLVSTYTPVMEQVIPQHQFTPHGMLPGEPTPAAADGGEPAELSPPILPRVPQETSPERRLPPEVVPGLPTPAERSPSDRPEQPTRGSAAARQSTGVLAGISEYVRPSNKNPVGTKSRLIASPAKPPQVTRAAALTESGRLLGRRPQLGLAASIDTETKSKPQRPPIAVRPPSADNSKSPSVNPTRGMSEYVKTFASSRTKAKSPAKSPRSAEQSTSGERSTPRAAAKDSRSPESSTTLQALGDSIR